MRLLPAWPPHPGRSPKICRELFRSTKGDLAQNQHSEQALTNSCYIKPKLKKVGKTTRPFRYDLNQIPYDYTVEVRNRFKRLDLIDRVLMNYGQKFMTLYRRQGSKPSPRKINAKKQNGCLRRPYR